MPALPLSASCVDAGRERHRPPEWFIGRIDADPMRTCAFSRDFLGGLDLGSRDVWSSGPPLPARPKPVRRQVHHEFLLPADPWREGRLSREELAEEVALVPRQAIRVVGHRSQDPVVHLREPGPAA